MASLLQYGAKWRTKERYPANTGVGLFMSVPKDLADLLEAGSHFGHQTRRWNPKMSEYIYTARDGVHVFDLTITADLLNKACDYVRDTVAAGREVIFIGTKRQAKAIVREEASKVGAPFVAERWLGGTLTNWEEISKRIKKLVDMKAARAAGEYKKYTKKENVLIDKDINRLDRFLGGIAHIKNIPDALFIVDTLKEKAAVLEAVSRGTKVIAIVDSNSNPDPIDFPIPANDDAVRSIKYIVSRLAAAYAEGKSVADKKKAAAAAPVKK